MCEEAAAAIGVEVAPFDVNSESEITAAFAGMAQRRAGAVLVTADPLFNSHRALLISLAGEYRAAGDLRISPSRRGRRHDELWDGADRRLQPSWALHWAHPKTRNRAIFRSCYRPISNSPSTSRLRSRWGSNSRPRCPRGADDVIE